MYEVAVFMYELNVNFELKFKLYGRRFVINSFSQKIEQFKFKIIM